tara:strand:+ start:522 stop:722 length:201 start_codon:yes stop_codon:yes gene_type:complete
MGLKFFLILYFCIMGDICNKFTTNEITLQVESCAPSIIEDKIKKILEEEGQPPRYTIIKHACYVGE